MDPQRRSATSSKNIVGTSSNGSRRKSALIIGSGFGGLALGIRLQSLGIDTTILEQLDAPGGRAYVRRADGFTFDMGPTVLTVPHFIEELFALEPGAGWLRAPDFPEDVLRGERITGGSSAGPATSRYLDIVPLSPFYRIYFDDGTAFDYDGDPDGARAQVAAISPGEVEAYERFHQACEAIFKRGFLDLGYTHFGSVQSMLEIAPDLFRLGAMQPVYSFVSKYLSNEKLRATFSFEPLLIGGNPLKVPAIYAMIHFVEKTWGVHFARGGTGSLVNGFVRKFEELGGTIRYNAPVKRIGVVARGGKPAAEGVTLANGETLRSDMVISNADYAATYGMVDRRFRKWHPDLRLENAKLSMSVVVAYFGFRADPRDAKLAHHNIILGPRYEGLLRDIFDRKILAADFSQYLHVPTLTDPSLAPEGHHAAYTLIPVPHNGSGIDWNVAGEPFVERVLAFLDERDYLPGLRERLVYKSFITPDYFEQTLGSRLGNAFGLEPIFMQSAFFRPSNRSEDIARLYLVGANTQPGGGTPAVMMSAKMTARLIAQDFGIV